MWLATLNPGRSARRGRRKRGKLSAWQRKVKKYGGVMQAVKAMRAEKRGRKKRRVGGRRRRFRRNSFLTTALTSGGAKVLMNAGKKRRRRKIRSRRSAVSRTSVRGRSRRAARRSKMARKTRRRRHRRTPPRGRGGRFLKSRSSHRRRRHRRVRRNPVLPISWNPSRRRRRRTRRNPLFLSRKGFSSRKHKGYRRLHRRRHSPRFWHNPRRRRSYRNNPVLPISWNPAGVLSAGGPVGAVVGRMKSFIDVKFWTETGIPAAAGFFGSKTVGNFIYQYIPNSVLTAAPQAQPYIRMAADAVGGGLVAWAISRFYDKKAGDAFWLGTVVNISYSLLKNLLGGTEIARTIGLDGLGDDLADRMRSEIARRVQATVNGGRLNGMGSYLRTTNLSEYVTEGALRESNAYSPGNALGDEGLGDPGF